MIKFAMNKSTKNVLIATLPTVLTYAVGKVVRAILKREKAGVKGKDGTKKSSNSHSVSCFKCGRQLKILSFKYKCTRCGHIFCSNCIQKLEVSEETMKKLRRTNGFVEPGGSFWTGYHLCPQCATGFKQEVRRMEASASSCEGVELVSSNYRGRKKYTGTPRYIETEYHRDREDSINELKTIARYYGCDMVIDVKCQRDVDDEETDSGGTYTYSVWSYSGKAVRKAD